MFYAQYLTGYRESILYTDPCFVLKTANRYCDEGFGMIAISLLLLRYSTPNSAESIGRPSWPEPHRDEGKSSIWMCGTYF